MSPPLVRARRRIESRFRALQKRLNDELGFRDQRLRFETVDLRNGTTNWVLRNNHNGTGEIVHAQRGVAELAFAENDDSILSFSYKEEWQPAGGRGQIEFIASNLRFVVSGVEDTADLSFRLEWAGARTEGNAVTYPGRGAAHPHWQLDVDSGWLAPPPAATAVEIDIGSGVEEIDLLGVNTGIGQQARISSTLAGFHRLHLPARAMWHDLLCEMPQRAESQQHTPQSEDEIDRWLISALRYLKHEFSAYL